MSYRVPNAEDLARFTLAVQHPVSRTWASDEERLALLAAEHAFDVRLAVDLDLARTRAERLGLSQPVEALLNQWLPVRPDLDALLSIRFEGGDVRLPFVDVTVTSRPLVAADVEALKAAAMDAYSSFGAGRLRCWAPDPVGSIPGTAPDLRVLAAPLADLRGSGVPTELELSPTPDDSQLAEATAAYATLDRRHPHHVREARIIDVAELAKAIAAGTMFDVWWRGRWSGYAGTLPESQLGLPAQVVQELLLAPHARGRGLGRHLSTLLARALPEDGRVLSGTIHGHNLGALRAAHAAGRVDIGGWSSHPLGAPPG